MLSFFRLRQIVLPGLAVRIITVCLIASHSWLLSGPLTGEVRGRVFDVEGLVPLSGVVMTLTHVDSGRSKEVRTDSRGNYLFIQLAPGRYTVLAKREEYYQNERLDILIRLNLPKVVAPPIKLRRKVSTPTRQITLQQAEQQTRVAVVDLTAAGPAPTVLAFLSEPGETSMVSLNNWALSANFDGALLQTLPLRGIRTFDQLALLSPGVSRVPFSSGQGPAVGLGVGSAGQFSVNGLRGRSNNFTVDGSDNNDEDIGMRRQGFVSLVSQSIESVEEFQVVRAGFAAEFGRNAGSMANAVSRSGAREVHGSVYGIFNDDALNAADFFDRTFLDSVNSGTLNGGRYSGPAFSRQQFGGVVGGAMLPDRLFYFASAEGQRAQGTGLAHFIVPSHQERGLRTRNGFVRIEDLGDFLSDRSYSSLAGEGVFSLYPLPNNSDGPFGPNTYSQARSFEERGGLFSFKTDWYISPLHAFTSRYNFSDDDSVIPFTSQAINSALATDTRTQNISLFLNSSRPGLGNMLRFSFGRTRLRFPPQKGSPLLFGSPQTDQLPPQFGSQIRTEYGTFGPFGATGPIGQLVIQPYSPIGVDVFNFPQGRVDNTFQFSDFMTWIRERHTLKAGFDVRRSQLNSFADRNARPLVVFGNGLVSGGCLANPSCPFATQDGLLRGTDLAALGAPAGFLQTISTGPLPDTTIGLRLTQFDFFLQDEWKLGARLTANFGLRYELQTVPSEVNGRIESTFRLQADQFGHLVASDSCRGQGANCENVVKAGNAAFDAALAALQDVLGGRTGIYDSDRNNFSPRIGLAWDPFGDATTVLRAGYSLSYDANLGAVTSRSRNVFPTFVPVNLDANFNPPNGQFLNSPAFFEFTPTGTRLIRPATLNTYNLGPEAFATGLGTLFGQGPASPFSNLSSNGLAFTLPQKDLGTTEVQHFVLSLQRQLGGDYLASVSYVRTQGRHLTRFTTPNAGLISTPILFSSPLQPLSIFDIPPTLAPQELGRPDTDLGAYTLFENTASSDYHSLQAELEKRLRRGLQFRVNWTWSHAIDEVSDPFQGRGFFPLPQQTLDTGQERGSANFDVRHRISWLLVWDLPSAARHTALQGWKLSMLGEFQTGQPFTVNTSLDRNFDGNLTDRLDTLQGLALQDGANPIRIEEGVDRLDLVAGRSQSGRVGRNSFRSQGIASVDAALSKSLSLSERAALDLRIEVFNLFNHTQLGIPVRILESPGFGRSFDTQVPARSIRFAFRLNF